MDTGKMDTNELAPEHAVAILANDYSFSYPNCSPVLSGLSWEVPEGSFQLMIGTTGSGKSTLLRCLQPALSPAGTQTGLLRVWDQVRSAACRGEFDPCVGFVSQSPDNQLVCDSVWHELAFGLENQGIDQHTMRKRVAEVAHFFGIESWFNKRTDQLSGGQKQLLCLAAVMALRPRLMVLDEPTAQLDPVAEKNFLHALFRINRELGVTVVVATHNPEAMVDYATSAVCLSDGKLGPVDLESLRAGVSPVESLRRHVVKDGPVHVRARDISISYPNTSTLVLDRCSLSVQAGSLHALVGGNGCGKTTLLKALAGVLKPRLGQVDNSALAQQAYLPQNPKSLFVCDSVAEELKEWQNACGYTDEDWLAWADRFNLLSRLELHPFDLSGGEQQQLALAKLLLTQPTLLLLDEPTKGLDAQAASNVAEAVLAYIEAGNTAVVATHDMTFVQLLADRVTLLFNGQDALTQTPDEFFADTIFYEPKDNLFAQMMEHVSYANKWAKTYK